MAEAAGLVLGVIPLVFYALDKYQDCLKFGRSYAKYKDTLMSIRDEVSVQQMLFHGTMETMGLYKSTYAELEECLQARFPDNHMQFMRCIKKMADTIDELMVKLEIDAISKVSEMVLTSRFTKIPQANRSYLVSRRMGMAAGQEKSLNKRTQEDV